MKERFIELLEQDAAQAHAAAQHWKALDGAHLEDGQGKPSQQRRRWWQNLPLGKTNFVQ